VTRAGTLRAALLATVETPTTWPLALGAFLIRGGIILLAVPILVLPTPVGLGDVLSPALSSIAFGSVPIELVVTTGAIGLGLVTWLLAGGWIAAVFEVETVRIVAGDGTIATDRAPAESAAAPAVRPSTTGESRRRDRLATRILVARLVAFIPLGIALALGSVRLVFVTYEELTSPLDVGTPLVMRVLRDSPEVVILVVLTWMVGEIVGGLAARRIVLAGAGAGGALRDAVVACLRHPLTTVVRFSLPTLVLGLVLAVSAMAAAAAWGTAAVALDERSDPLPILVAVVIFVGLWIGGLLAVSVVCAWRAAVWTVAEVTWEGTFGGSSDRQPGHWQPDPSSGTL
jgi:hypothetical protein